MKKTTYAMICLLMAFAVFSQRPVVPQTCLSGELLHKHLQNNPELRQKLKSRPLDVQGYSNNLLLRSGNDPVLTIPVVVYVVYDPANPASNITDTQVNSQMSALNTYFEDYNLKFCLATKAGTTAITGINHINNATLSNHNTATEQQALSNLSGVVTKERYLRIWVVNTIDGPSSPVQGYAEFPSFNPVFDGIVIKYNVFGDVSNCSGCPLVPELNQGKILVHEIGHYLGLMHTFEGGCAGMTTTNCWMEGDYVCDTPPVNAPNFSCVGGINSCTENPNYPDLIQNFMDYGDNYCVDSFTAGQKERMFDTLETFRNVLASPDNNVYTGTCGYLNIISANFTPDSYMPCSNTSVTFSSANNPNLDYQWNFGDPSSSSNTASGAIASHVYSMASTTPYTVTLTATNLTTLDSSTTTQQIYVSVCNPISSSEGNWYFNTSNGLNFNSGAPVIDTSIPQGDIFREPSAVQNTPAGSLLFYTNGIQVYNNVHTVINSSTPLMGHRGGRDSAIIVPDPVAANQYYIFTNTASDQMVWPENGFRYSKINVSGTTATMGSLINQPVTVPTGYITGNNGAVHGNEGLTAMKSCSGYYILNVLKKTNQYFIVVYELKANAGGTASELTVKSEFGLPTSIAYLQWARNASLEFSPNGNKLALSILNTQIYLFDFDKIAGIISDQQIIDLQFRNAFGISFSPDSNLLYASGMNFLFQYNLNAANVAASKATIVDTGNADSAVQPGLVCMQRGPDNKLYMNKYNKRSLAVIHNPNNLSTPTNLNACNYSNNGPFLRDFTSFGLPNFIDARDVTAYTSPISISTYRTGCQSYKFFPNTCGSSFNWNISGPGTNVNFTVNDPVYTFINNGAYTVTLKNSSNTVTLATTSVTIAGLPTPIITGSTSACLSETNNAITSNTVSLSSGQTVVWTITGGAGVISGANNHASVTVNWTTLPGIITATVSEPSGCSRTVTRNIASVCECDCLNTAYFTALGFGNSMSFSSGNTNTSQLCADVFAIHYWSFGDGTYSMQYHPTHIYPAPGTYTVSMQSRILNEYDKIICSATYTHTVTVTNNGGIKGRAASGGFDEGKLVLYPNPASHAVNIELELLKAQTVTVILRSIDGKTLAEYLTPMESGKQHIDFDLPPGLSHGMILVEVFADQSRTVRKLMVKN